MTDVVLDPALDEAVESGDHALLLQWLAAEGDAVQAGQLLARAWLVGQTLDVRAPRAGMIEDILVPGGQTFPPGAVLARLIPH